MNKKLLAKMKMRYPSFSDEVLERMYLFQQLNKDTISDSGLIRLTFLVGMITKDQYADYTKIEAEFRAFS